MKRLPLSVQVSDIVWRHTMGCRGQFAAMASVFDLPFEFISACRASMSEGRAA